MKNPLSIFFKLFVIAMSVSLLSGCHHYHALDSTKKAKMVSELISGTKDCAVFKKKLTSPSMDDDSIDDVYREATKAGCINKDV